ncbi:hypothetical protein MBLNU459_g7276t1 [Dothideomycetes sp. NU459]
MIKSFGFDDSLILITLIFFCLQSGYLARVCHNELYRDLTQLGALNETLEDIIIEIAFYCCTMIFLKLSLAVFFLRVCLERWQRWIIIISATIYTLYTVGYLFVAIFQCGNPGNFLLARLDQKCLSWSTIAPLNYIHGSLNAVTDWGFAVLPIFVLQRSNMPPRAKWSVCGILALGALGSVASVVRLAYIQVLHEGSTTFFHDSVSIAICSIIEPGLGITAASLATLRPLFHDCLALHRKNRPATGSSEGKRDIADSDAIFSDATKLVAQKRKSGGMFATYGFTETLNGKTATSDMTTTCPDDLDLGDLSGFATDLPFDGRADPPSRNNSSKSELLEDLHAARAAYEQRKWTGDGDFVQPNLLLPDI